MRKNANRNFGTAKPAPEELFKAIRDEDYARVKNLLDRGADVNSKIVFETYMDLTPLRAAAQGNNTAIAELLLDRGAKIEDTNGYGWNALHSAAQEGNAQMVRFLLRRGAKIEAKEEGDLTALLLAAGNGKTEVVQILLENNADMNLVDHAGQTPLILAAASGHTAMVQLLLDHGADVNEKQHGTDWTPLLRAVYGDHPETIKLLLDNGADRKASISGYGTPLDIAVRNATYDPDPYFENTYPTKNHAEVLDIIKNYKGGPAKKPQPKPQPQSGTAPFVPKPTRNLKLPSNPKTSGPKTP